MMMVVVAVVVAAAAAAVIIGRKQSLSPSSTLQTKANKRGRRFLVNAASNCVVFS